MIGNPSVFRAIILLPILLGLNEKVKLSFLTQYSHRNRPCSPQRYFIQKHHKNQQKMYNVFKFMFIII